MVISRKYYKNRLWKITTKLVSHHKYPGCAKNGFSYCKFYERREAIGSNWVFVRGTTTRNDTKSNFNN